MPELRQNSFTKEWVIIATERAKRPEELATHRPRTQSRTKLFCGELARSARATRAKLRQRSCAFSGIRPLSPGPFA